MNPPDYNPPSVTWYIYKGPDESGFESSKVEIDTSPDRGTYQLIYIVRSVIVASTISRGLLDYF